jgi:hypothetical protein
VKIYPAGRVEVEVPPELGMVRSTAASHADSPVANRVGIVSIDHSTPPGENACDGPVAVCWAVAFLWYGAKLAQIRVIFLMFLILVSNLLDL